MSINHKRLLCLRHYFTLSATNEEYAESRILSVKTAFDIAAERRMHSFPFDDALDTVVHVLPAAIVLLLDCLYPLPGRHVSLSELRERCLEVEVLLNPLRGVARSGRQSTEVTNTFAAVDALLVTTFSRVQKEEAALLLYQQHHQPPLPPHLPQPLHPLQQDPGQGQAVPGPAPVSAGTGAGATVTANPPNDNPSTATIDPPISGPAQTHPASVLQPAGADPTLGTSAIPAVIDADGEVLPDPSFTEMLKELGFGAWWSFLIFSILQ